MTDRWQNAIILSGSLVLLFDFGALLLRVRAKRFGGGFSFDLTDKLAAFAVLHLALSAFILILI